MPRTTRWWVLALAAVATLHGAALLQAPTSLDLPDLAEHEGARVLVRGRVLDARGGEGWLRLDVTDGTVRVPVFATGAHLPVVAAGDEVWAAGRVTLHEGAYELRSRGVDLRVLHPAHRPAPLALVAADPARFVGTPLVLEGVAHREAGGWVLRGEDAALDARFASTAGLDPGTALLVEGVLEDDDARARYVLEVRTWRRP